MFFYNLWSSCSLKALKYCDLWTANLVIKRLFGL